MTRIVSIAERMEVTRGRSSGFDYLRLILAVSIIVWHAFGTSYGLPITYRFMASAGRPIVAAILPMFFALSGFLVAGSLERSPTLFNFLALRALRIGPALMGEVILSALVLGPLLTTVPLERYFGDPVFRVYFLNVFGYIHYVLPGLFPNNPIPHVVNGQLWTIPRELACYVSLTGLAVLGIVKRTRGFAIGIAAVGTTVALLHLGENPARLAPARVVDDLVLISAFLAGVAIFGLRQRIAWSGGLLVLAVLASGCLLSIPGGDYLVALPLAYVTIYLGLLDPRKIFLLLRGADYSYGLFLYGWAVQQAVMTLGSWAHHWYWNLAIALPASTAIAALSWHCIEKPALGLRRHLPNLERGALRLAAGPRT